MHGISGRAVLIHVALTLTLCLPATVVSAENLVVFESSSDTFKPGQTIDAAKDLTLKDGQTVSLISSTGKIVRLSGPFSGVPAPKSDEKASSVKGALYKLLAEPNKDSSNLGLTRSADDVLALADKDGALPEPWLIDVHANGNHCIREGERVIFWRAESSTKTEVRVRTGSGLEGRTEWSAGKSRLSLPETLPLREGEFLRIEVGGAATDNIVHVVPKTVADIPVLAAWLKAKGCRDQFLSVVRSAM